MGLLVDGQWVDRWYDTKSTGGRFERKAAGFRNWIEPGGRFAPEAGRYHLYVSHACPWAHRTLIFRALKGLETMIEVSVVNWLMLDKGWTFANGPGVIADPVMNAQFMHQIYTAAQGDYTGRVTVPVLWDKQTGTIVSNESAEIIRMFNTAFDGLGAAEGDFYPAALRGQIDALNARIYETVNNGVYRCGFATTQEAYDEAITPLFESLDWLEGILAQGPYLTGGQVTEADWRLFTTLVRFDAVYVRHFKTNLRRIADYPHLQAYLERLYNRPKIKETVHMDHIKGHYFQSHPTINPNGIIPAGPNLPWL